ncbi:MAG TPA: L-threonine 3-dehydrogenase, partial [Acholeplasmataceae bacterium]|nr:L-threonine 3-dehydrogenase [Acholeplasmataceae bacterium]
FKTWDQVTELVQSGKLNIEEIITHTLPLKDIEKGMEIMISGNSGKVVLIP